MTQILLTFFACNNSRNTDYYKTNCKEGFDLLENNHRLKKRERVL